jgi:hypothetical protein
MSVMAVKRRSRRNYYGSLALSKAERLELRRAGSVEGLADEIALLRAKLKRTVEAAPGDAARERRRLKVVAQAMETLLKAVSTDYRLSPRGRDRLGDNIARVIDQLGDQLLPPDR